MNDTELQVLLDGMAGVPVLADRREALRARIETRRRRHRRLVAASAATVAVGLFGAIAIEVGAWDRNESTLSAAPIASERVTAGGDAVVVRSRSDGQMLVEVAGIEALASTTDRPVPEYAVIDPPATSGFAITGSTMTKDEHNKPIIVVVVHILDGGVHRVRVSLADGAGDEATQSGGVAVLVLRPTRDDDLQLPTVRAEAINADGTTTSTLDVVPFTQRPWSCDTNTQLAEATPASTIVADSNSERKPSVPSVLIAPPLRARCPGD